MSFTRRHSPQISAFFLLSLITATFPASAQEDELDQGKVFAIQDRAYRMNHELGLSLAFLPLDAFYKFFVISGHYTVHFDDFWAWEAIHLSFSKYLDIDTGLKKELNDRWGASATDTPRIDYFIDTNLMVKPLYGKMALFDSWVIQMETYILAGVGAERFESGAWFPAVDLGVGFRIFMNNRLSLRFEAREYVYLADSGVDSTLYFGASFCYNAFAEDKRVGQAEEVKP